MSTAIASTTAADKPQKKSIPIKSVRKDGTLCHLETGIVGPVRYADVDVSTGAVYATFSTDDEFYELQIDSKGRVKDLTRHLTDKEAMHIAIGILGEIAAPYTIKQIAQTFVAACKAQDSPSRPRRGEKQTRPVAADEPRW